MSGVLVALIGVLVGAIGLFLMWYGGEERPALPAFLLGVAVAIAGLALVVLGVRVRIAERREACERNGGIFVRSGSTFTGKVWVPRYDCHRTTVIVVIRDP